jgi:hypothetical protein
VGPQRWRNVVAAGQQPMFHAGDRGPKSAAPLYRNPAPLSTGGELQITCTEIMVSKVLTVVSLMTEDLKLS